MSTIEAALRGGAVALLVLLAANALHSWRRSPAARYGALFAASVTPYVGQSAPNAPLQQSVWLLPPRLISIGTPAVFCGSRLPQRSGEPSRRRPTRRRAPCSKRSAA